MRSLHDELQQQALRIGSLEESVYIKNALNAGRYSEDVAAIEKTVQTLQGKGCTAAEIKGFFQFANRACNFIKSK